MQRFVRPAASSTGLMSQFSGAPVVRAIVIVTVLTSIAEFLGVVDIVRLGLVPQGFAEHETWQFLTHALVHGSFLHLAFNMYALFALGVPLEKQIGSKTFGALYLLATLVGGALVYVLSSGLTVGASGAVYGLFGFWLGTALSARKRGHGSRQLRSFAPILVINLFISLQRNVSWQGHLGGFLAGLVFYWVWITLKRQKSSAI